MTQPTTNAPPETVTQDKVTEAMRVLGLDPKSVHEVHILAENVVVLWDKGDVGSDVPPAFRSYTSIVEIVPVATCANCGRGMNAGDPMCCPLPQGGAA